MTKINAPFCWHCGKALSNQNNPKKEYWHRLVEIEPGRKVKVHVTCEAAAKASVKKVTAAQREAYHGDIDGDFGYW